MNTLNLKITGTQKVSDCLVYIDDKPAKFKTNEFKNLTCSYDTMQDRVNIKVFKPLDVGGVWWFILQLFFFVISIFGIFDVYSKKRFIGIKFECDVQLGNTNNIVLNFNQPKESGKAIEVQTDLAVTETTNEFYTDKKAKKKYKALLISKIILAVAIIATVTGLLFTRL